MVDYVTKENMLNFIHNTVTIFRTHFSRIKIEEPNFLIQKEHIYNSSIIIKILYDYKYVNCWITFCNNEYVKVVFRLSICDNFDTNYGFDLYDYFSFKQKRHSKEALLNDKYLINNSIENVISTFIDELDKVISDNEIQCILNTNYKPEIPIDWSQCGYK